MTTPQHTNNENCPAQGLLKMLAGKWKPEIFRLAVTGPLRFSGLMRQIPGANKQTMAIALKELEEADLLHRTVVSEKPLHISYSLTDRGQLLVPLLLQIEHLLQR